MALTRISGTSLTNRRNHIINGGMMVAQRGTSFVSDSEFPNSDDAYTLDRFYILSDGNDIVDVTQTSTVPDEALKSMGLDVETANKKFGIAQIIENENCTGLIGNTVTLSFEAKVSNASKLDNIKAAIVSWSGTADSVTSDIISAWGSEGTNPTLISNATYENTPANLGVTTSFVKYSVTGTVDTSGTNNIVVFIWSDVTDTTAGHFLYITNVQLEKGNSASDFEHKSFQEELSSCQRYYHEGQYAFMTSSATTCIFNIDFPVTMRTSPTTSHEYSDVDNDIYNLATAATPTFVPNGSFVDVNSYKFAYDFDAGLTADDGYQSYFYFDSEL